MGPHERVDQEFGGVPAVVIDVQPYKQCGLPGAVIEQELEALGKGGNPDDPGLDGDFLAV